MEEDTYEVSFVERTEKDVVISGVESETFGFCNVMRSLGPPKS